MEIYTKKIHIKLLYFSITRTNQLKLNSDYYVLNKSKNTNNYRSNNINYVIENSVATCITKKKRKRSN